jgi:hypothetical protein
MPLQGKKLPEAATYSSIQNQKGLTYLAHSQHTLAEVCADPADLLVELRQFAV